MIDIDVSLKRFPVVSMKAGDVLLEQGNKIDTLYFLISGEVAVIKDGFEVTHRSQGGSVYGEMSMLSGNPHSATVKCLSDCSFYCVKEPKKNLEDDPAIIWHIAKILGTRLAGLNEYLVDVKTRYESQEKEPLSDEERSAGREKMLNEILQILQV